MGPVKSPVYAVTVDPEFLQEDFPLVFFQICARRISNYRWRKKKPSLIGGFSPFEKNARQNGFIFPKFRVEHEKYLKPLPTRELTYPPKMAF